MNQTSPPNNKSTLKKTLLSLGLTVVIAIAGYMLIIQGHVAPPPEPTIFDQLRKLGYEPNIGFSGNYQPGNTLQIAERGDNDQDKPLPTPIVYLWADDCFPGNSPRRSVFVLPESKKTSTSTLTMKASEIATFLPALQVDTKSASDYTMSFDQPYVSTFAKGTLSQNFSPACMKAFNDINKAGEKSEWYATIVEAVMAESMRLEIHWSSNTSIEARNTLKEQYAKTLQTMRAIVKNDKTEAPSLKIDIETDTQEKTVMRSDQPVIVAYRYRKLDYVKNK